MPGTKQFGARLPFANRLRIPLIAAPMTSVSGPSLVTAACSNGVVGSFPTHNARTSGQLDEWLEEITSSLESVQGSAPLAPNLVVHRSNKRLKDDVSVLIDHGVELVITSVGSPEQVVAPLQSVGCQVYADVASLAHAERAIDLGVDGLVLLGAGAGGQTGWANPFAFVRAVRERFDGVVVLAGGMSDGTALHAALVLGADLAYMGTKFIATSDSAAEADYKGALVTATLDDVRLSNRVGGIPASVLEVWLDRLPREAESGSGFEQTRLLDHRTAWSAGHSVSGVRSVGTVADLIEATAVEFESSIARAEFSILTRN
jgi:nitronate monooxygenase